MILVVVKRVCKSWKCVRCVRIFPSPHSFITMYLTILSFFFVLSALAQPLFALPYVFERVVNDTTSLAPNSSRIQKDLGPLLSKGASLYFPGTSQFDNATSRWSAYAEPQIAVVVEPANANDVATTV